MKKALVLAVSMAAMAGGAHAAWDKGAAEEGLGGELLFTAWDGEKSYSYDLGLRYSQFQTGGGVDAVFDLDGFQFSAGDNFSWSIIGGSKRKTLTFESCIFPAGASQEDCFPGAENFTVSQADTGLVASSKNGMPNSRAAADTFVYVDGVMSTFAAALNGSDADNSINGPATQVIGETDYFGQSQWTLNMGPYTGNQDSLTMEMWLLASNADGSAAMPELRGLATIDFLGGNGPQLQFTSVAEIPVPAAVWLFGSALATLGAFRRKQKA